MVPRNKPSAHGITFSFLVFLVLGSVGASLMHLPPSTNNVIVLAAAFFMAGLVVSQYMGLKVESWVVRLTVAVPVVLFIILVVLLLPDIAHFPVPSFLKL